MQNEINSAKYKRKKELKILNNYIIKNKNQENSDHFSRIRLMKKKSRLRLLP